MTNVIKGGTVVTHDLTDAAGVLIDGGEIAAVGPDLAGDTAIGVTAAHVRPGGIDPQGV